MAVTTRRACPGCSAPAPGDHAWIAIAAVGHGATQAQQQVHVSLSMVGIGAPPWRGAKRMARTAQKSPQTRHSIPCRGRQASLTSALQGQAGRPSQRTSANGWQAAAHSPQKEHSRWLKSTVGNPPSPGTRILCGHAVRQSPQRVQRSMNVDSGEAQGGRISALGRGRPRRKPRRLASIIPAGLLSLLHLVDAAAQHLVEFRTGFDLRQQGFPVSDALPVVAGFHGGGAGQEKRVRVLRVDLQGA